MTWKVLKTEEDYTKASMRLMEIFHAKPNTSESDELDLLIVLIKDYDDKVNINNDLIEIKHYVETVSGISELALERKNDLGVFGEWANQILQVRLYHYSSGS